MAAAAFFDLDRTLMAGSSGLHWARAAHRSGLLPRRQLWADAWANVMFRLQGSTDEASEKVRDRVGAWIEGRRVVDLDRLSPLVLSGVSPRLYPQMLDVAYRHQDAGVPVFICTAATQGTADMLAHVLGFDGAAGSRLEARDGVYTGGFDGPFCYREGKPVRMRGRPAAWTSRRPGRTRTPSPTCPCSARSGTRWRSTPTASSRSWPARRAGRSCASRRSAGA